MTELHVALARVDDWRASGYAHDQRAAVRITDMLGEEILVAEDRPSV